MQNTNGEEEFNPPLSPFGKGGFSKSRSWDIPGLASLPAYGGQAGPPTFETLHFVQGDSRPQNRAQHLLGLASRPGHPPKRKIATTLMVKQIPPLFIGGPTVA